LDGDTDNLGLIPHLPSSCQKENMSKRNQRMSKIEEPKLKKREIKEKQRRRGGVKKEKERTVKQNQEEISDEA